MLSQWSLISRDILYVAIEYLVHICNLFLKKILEIAFIENPRTIRRD